MTTAGARGPYARTSGRREEILRAALASFADHGYERSSLRDIAARAGITHAGLLHHFSSKQELLTEAVALHDADSRSFAAARIAEGASPLSVIEDLLAHALEDPAMVRDWLSLTLAASGREHPAHKDLAARQRRARGDLIDVQAVVRSPGVGGVDSLDADTKATMVLALLDGLQLQSLENPDRDVLTPLRALLSLLFGSWTVTTAMPANLGDGHVLFSG